MQIKQLRQRKKFNCFFSALIFVHFKLLINNMVIYFLQKKSQKIFYNSLKLIKLHEMKKKISNPLNERKEHIKKVIDNKIIIKFLFFNINIAQK